MNAKSPVRPAVGAEQGQGRPWSPGERGTAINKTCKRIEVPRAFKPVPGREPEIDTGWSPQADAELARLTSLQKLLTIILFRDVTIRFPSCLVTSKP
ncbi:hypothetical protein CMUS01_04512, partial [Colletotrichum musicola]